MGIQAEGRLCKTYIDLICEDTRLNAEDLPTAMQDRNGWKQRIRIARAIRPIR